jgi:hypothetical protein
MPLTLLRNSTTVPHARLRRYAKQLGSLRDIVSRLWSLAVFATDTHDAVSTSSYSAAMSKFDSDDFSLPSLPSSRDGLFKVGSDTSLNACVNWRSPDWNLYATGYKTAADMLATYVVERRVRQDSLVYPILFLYRQYIELALKEIIRSGLTYLERDPATPKHHDLGQLWALAEKLLEEICPGDSVPESKETGRIIKELNKVDPQSDAFRYLVNKRGEQSLQGITQIDIGNVQAVAARLAVMLDGATTQIGVYQDWKYDMESFYGTAYDEM